MPIAPPHNLNAGDPPHGDSAVLADSHGESGESAECALELIRQDWTRVALGIILAGIGYALSLASLWATFAIFYVLVPKLGQEPAAVFKDPFTPLVSLIFYSVLVAGAAGTWTTMVVLVLLPLTYVVAWTLRLRGSMVWLGAVAGGVVGFVATMPLTTNVVRSIGHPNVSITSDIWSVLLVMTLGPALATIAGQVGGAWGGLLSKARTRQREEVRQYVPAGSLPVRDAEPVDSDPQGGPWLHFSLRHMLWAAVWFSLLFSVMRLSGFDLAVALPILLSWLGFQAFTLWTGAHLWRVWQARRAR